VLRGTAYIAHLRAFGELVLLKEAVNVKLGELESALIHTFLLNVEHISAMWNIEQLMLNLMHWERSELFQTENQCLMVLWERLSLNLLHYVEIDLARTDKYLLIVLACSEGVCIDRLECGSWQEFLHGRHCPRMFETDLGGGKDQWLSVVSQHLPSQ
jgi:hypothetical protein